MTTTTELKNRYRQAVAAAVAAEPPPRNAQLRQKLNSAYGGLLIQVKSFSKRTPPAQPPKAEPATLPEPISERPSVVDDATLPPSAVDETVNRAPQPAQADEPVARDMPRPKQDKAPKDAGWRSRFKKETAKPAKPPREKPMDPPAQSEPRRPKSPKRESEETWRRLFKRQDATKAKAKSKPSAAKVARESSHLELGKTLGGAFAYAGVLTIFINLAMLFVPLYSMILFDRVLQSRSYDTLTMLTIVCGVGMVIYASLEFYRSMVFMVIGDKLTRGLNIPTLRASIARSLSGEPAAGAQALRDLDSLRNFTSSISPIVSLDVIWTPIILVILYLLHPWYGYYALICAGLLFVLSIANDLATRADMIAANSASSTALGDLSGALRQRELIDGLGMLPEIARRWIDKQDRLMAQTGAISRRSHRFAVIARTARIAMQAGGTAVGVILVIHHNASPGSLIGASILIGKLLLPFEQLLTAWRQWTAAFASWHRISDLLAATSSRKQLAPPAHIEGRLILDRATYAPLSVGEPILTDVTLTIEPGEVIGVIGPSGAGKSTLARLVMGIHQPTSGQVTFDGVATAEWDRAELARHVSYLAQSIGLLDGTILENIARMDNVDPHAAIEAANRAGVHDLVGRMRDGYDTQVGDGGQALSGGTRQRIALARALYGHPKLVVLDEPNAHLDHDGELALVHVIKQLKASGSSVLLITHRPAILACVDRVVTIEQGRVARIEQSPARPELNPANRAPAQVAI